MRKMLISTVVLSLLLFASHVFAADVNYAEVLGNVVAMETVTEYNSLTQVSTVKEVSVTVKTAARGVESITVTCPTDGSSLYYLCRNREALLVGYCPTATATSTCYPDASGICSLYHTEACTSGVGKCVWGWGYLRTSGGVMRPHLDNLYTRSQTTCTLK